MPKGGKAPRVCGAFPVIFGSRCLIYRRWQRYVSIVEEIRLAQGAGRKCMTIASRILARET